MHDKSRPLPGHNHEGGSIGASSNPAELTSSLLAWNGRWEPVQLSVNTQFIECILKHPVDVSGTEQVQDRGESRKKRELDL